MKRSLLDIANQTIKDLSKLIACREISCLEVVDATIERIERLNPKLNAFITILDDSARSEAKHADSLIKQGKYLGPLHGIPISLKDLIYVKEVKSTSGSKILADFVPDYDSTVTKKLRKAGAIIVGTNNTHEFACGITNINPHYGSSKNPWDISRISGGSSGGSAVAVSTGMSLASIGTDTSGSIRVPSSLCGIFGLKPTYGRVSKHGVMPLAPSIDHVGPLARSAWDIAAVLQIIAGYDKLDTSSAKMPVPDYLKEISSSETKNNNYNNNSKKFKIGIPKQFFFDIIEPKVMEIFREFVDRLHDCGITITSNVDVDGTDKIFETWRAIRLGESAATHDEWMVSRPQDYGEDVIRMLGKGLEITAVQYLNALHKWRQEIKDAFLKAMSEYDALLVPTTIIPAPSLNQKEVNIEGKTIEVYSSLSRLTTVFDITGLPALNIPASLVDSKLPVGVQLVGRPFDEARILKIAYMVEQKYKLPEQLVPPMQ
ncbi:MAG TPA: amidase [Nitrososphaeraceae archaeon]|nr:amidase [Nitrososphaeraceae archaeon]